VSASWTRPADCLFGPTQPSRTIPRPLLESFDGQVPPPLPGGSNALLPIARSTRGDQVGRGGRASARPGIDVVDVGGVAAAITTGPLIALQDGAPQQRVDPALSGIVRSRVPVEKGMGWMGRHR
jgi:hypothetical protein